MATIKSHTDLKQSKILSEILPLESADMCYRYYSGGMITGYGDCILAKSFITGKNVIRENDLPCWSLAALLSILRNVANNIDEDASVNLCSYKNVEWGLSMDYTKIGFMTNSNLVDVCYGMIVELHEQKLL